MAVITIGIVQKGKNKEMEVALYEGNFTQLYDKLASEYLDYRKGAVIVHHKEIDLNVMESKIFKSLVMMDGLYDPESPFTDLIKRFLKTSIEIGREL